MSKLTKKEKSELARKRAIEEKSRELAKSKSFIQSSLTNIVSWYFFLKIIKYKVFVSIFIVKCEK